MKSFAGTAPKLIPALALAALLSGCIDDFMEGPHRPVATQAAPPPMAPPPAPTETMASRYGDSDDYVCNHGAPDDPRTGQACAHLRGADSPAVAQPAGPGVGTGRFGDSDDYLCNHGAPDDPRTVQACARLRAPNP